MRFSKVAVVALLLMAFNGVCLAVVYDVGEAAGWTKNGAVDYTAWAASKKFYIGDTIVFRYGNGEKLLRVNHTDFKKCETRFPVATYTSGNDSFLMKRSTHIYFIGAVYGDCMAGQKVDIKVPSSAAHSAPAPTPSLSPSPSPAVPNSPSPSPASTTSPSPSPAVPDSPSPAPASTPSPSPSPAIPDSPSPAPAPASTPNASPSPSPSPVAPDSSPVAPILTPEATPSPAVPDSPPLAPAPRSNAFPSPVSATGLLHFSSLLIALFFV